MKILTDNFLNKMEYTFSEFLVWKAARFEGQSDLEAVNKYNWTGPLTNQWDDVTDLIQISDKKGNCYGFRLWRHCPSPVLPLGHNDAVHTWLLYETVNVCLRNTGVDANWLLIDSMSTNKLKARSRLDFVLHQKWQLQIKEEKKKKKRGDGGVKG